MRGFPCRRCCWSFVGLCDYLGRLVVRLDTLVGGTHDTASSLNIKKKAIFSFGFLLKSCNLGGLFVFRGPITVVPLLKFNAGTTIVY